MNKFERNMIALTILVAIAVVASVMITINWLLKLNQEPETLQTTSTTTIPYSCTEAELRLAKKYTQSCFVSKGGTLTDCLEEGKALFCKRN